MKFLYTIGYQGRKIDAFIRTLSENGITLLIDVREYPISRKAGFSKSSIARSCEEAGIKYEHIKEAGTPKAIRQKYLPSGNYQSALNAYGKYISEKSEVIGNIYENVVNNNACLMCFEGDPEMCHRSVLADKIRKFNHTKIQTINL